jgi:hypothetical protein
MMILPSLGFLQQVDAADERTLSCPLHADDPKMSPVFDGQVEIHLSLYKSPFSVLEKLRQVLYSIIVRLFFLLLSRSGVLLLAAPGNTPGFCSCPSRYPYILAFKQRKSQEFATIPTFVPTSGEHFSRVERLC